MNNHFPVEWLGIITFVVILVIAVCSVVLMRIADPLTPEEPMEPTDVPPTTTQPDPVSDWPTAPPDPVYAVPLLACPMAPPGPMLATVQILGATGPATNGTVQLAPPYIGYTDEDDAWIRRNWADNMAGHQRQYIWRIEFFMEVAKARGVAVLLRSDLKPGVIVSKTVFSSQARESLRGAFIEGIKF